MASWLSYIAMTLPSFQCFTQSESNMTVLLLPMQGGAFFVDGPRGTGKAFLYSLLLARVRSAGDIALPVASFGIAALLLAGGKTAHSRFKIPVRSTSTPLASTSQLTDCESMLSAQ